MNGENVWMNNESVIFAVDQEPFEDTNNAGKWFCFLYPLMTLEGKRFAADASEFPNTGRVWWMLDDFKRNHAIPGAIWCGTIEEHPSWNKHKDNPRHNRFQARKDNIRHGGADLIEIIDLPYGDPQTDLLYRGHEIRVDKPPIPTVFLRGPNFTMGPLRTTWYPDRLSISLEAMPFFDVDPDKPAFIHISNELFYRYARVEQFNFEARKLDYAASPIPISLTLTRKAWLDLDKLRQYGDYCDGLTDKELLSWALRTREDLSLSRQERRQINRFLEQLSTMRGEESDVIIDLRFERLKTLSDNIQHVSALGEDIAEKLGSSVFSELVKQHLDTLVEKDLEREKQKRRHEIETATQGMKRELEQLKSTHRTRQELQENELKLEREKTEREILAMRESLREKQRELEKQQALLENTRQIFLQDSDQIMQQWLTLFPLVHSNTLVQVPSTSPPIDTNSVWNKPSELQLPKLLKHHNIELTSPISEEEFIEQFESLVASEGFLFDSQDLRNFHICVKTGYLTVLAGRTGMGKSSLPWLYAKSLGVEDEFLHVAIRPDWLDDRDLLGAFNAIARRFEPASSGFTERLIVAQEDWVHKRGGMYLTCLDEMNLARVEHYFAQFLSVLEKPESQRLIQLFAPGLVDADDPYSPYPHIQLHDNIRFIGTVNIDETAFFLSPKVLDRAQVVVFQEPDLSQPLPDISSVLNPISPISLDTYLSWRCKPSNDPEVRTFLLKLDQILRRSRLGFGFRQFYRMLTYIASSEGLIDVSTAIDFQLMQVVIPRLRRTAPFFRDTLEALVAIIEEHRYPRSARMISRIRESDGEDDFFQLI